MPSIILTDVASDTWAEPRKLSAADFGLAGDHAWSVAWRSLKGGRRDGVDLIELDNGALSLAIVPTRGMGLWRARFRGVPLGWRSPVLDGPVHPAFVNLADRGGLGWLDGFDELMVRCGLTSNGAPYEVVTTNSDGSVARRETVGLHGRIANIPAHHVSVHVDEAPPHAITVEGRVAESTVFLTQIEMTTTITTEPGSNRFVVRDEFVNRSDSPGSMQLLYHWNLGPPYLGEGAEFVAPIESLAPRDPRAAEGLGHWTTYGAPEAGFAEQVYLARLRGDGPEGRTLALLKAPGGTRGVVLRFRNAQLPCFTLWKCTRGAAEGYVTGLEPATNYPNPRPFEEARGRVVPLGPGGRFVAETVFEVLEGVEAVAAAEAEVAALQAQGAPTIHPKAVEPFTAAG